MVRATLYIPPNVDFAYFNDRLHHYCAGMAYEIAGIDRDGRPWWDSLVMAHEMHVDVIVAASDEHIPGDRTPRLEIADMSALRPDLPGGGRAKARNRRPRPM